MKMLQNPHVLLTFEEVHNPLRLPRETTSEPPKVVRTPRCFKHFDFKMCFAPQRRALFRHLNFQKWSENGVLCTFALRNVLPATTACTFSTSQFPKVVREWCALYILTSNCASRDNGVDFFDISISKSGPRIVCFVNFHFEMCFAPQLRALFRHLNFQKWSDTEVFCTCSLRNVLRATTACTFDISTSKSGPDLGFAPQQRALFRHRNFQKWSDNGVFCTCSLRNACFAPQWRAIFHLSSGQLAPHPPL